MKRFYLIAIFLAFFQTVILGTSKEPITLRSENQTILLYPARGYSASGNLQLKLFFAPTDSIVLMWSKALSDPNMKLKVGKESGSYNVGSLSVSGVRKAFVPGEAPLNLGTGRYYALITNSEKNTFDEIERDHAANPSVEFSNEIQFIVEAPNAPVPISPRGEITDATPLFQWDAIPGVPAYWLIVSSTPFSVVTLPSGEISVQGANIVWNYITTETSVRYGDINSDSPYNTEAAPLLSGNEYNYTILNLYDEKDISYASTVFSGAFSFTYKAKQKIDAPVLVAPLDSSTIYGEETIRFSWDPVQNANSYTVYLYQRVQSFAGNDQQIDIPIWNTSTTNTSVNYPALSTLTRGSYVWNVMATDAEGNGALSQTFLFNYVVEMGAFRVQAISTLTGENLIGFQVEANAVSGGVSPANPFIVTNSRTYTDSLVVGTYNFVGSKDGYFDSTFTYEVKKGELTEVKIYLRPYPSIISGTVVDQDGKNLDGATVEIENILNGNTYSANTSINGTFSIVAPKGTYSLRAFKAGYISSSPITITADDNQYALSQAIVLVLDKATVAGKVLNDEGKAVILATVKATKGGDVLQTVTNEEGAYSFDLTSGTWKLECEKTGFISPDPSYVNLAAGDNVQNQNLILTPRANQVTGFVYKVLSEGGTTPFENVTVTAVPDAGNVVTTQTSSGGHYNLSLKSGSYTISASKQGYTSSKSVQLTLTVAETVSDINFTLTPNPSVIRGTVSDANGNPIGGAKITADGAQAQSLPNGSYSLSVSAGTFDVTAYKDGYITSEPKKVSVSPGQTLTGINFVLTPNAGVIAGKVTSGGQPVNGATVEATNGNADFTVTTDAEGKYSFSIEPGTWNVSAVKTGFVKSAAKTITVGPGQQSMNNNFELVRNIATINGTVESGLGPVSGAEITITETGNQSNSLNTVSAENGSFSAQVEAGKSYNVKVTKKGYADYNYSTAVLGVSSVTTLNVHLNANPSSLSGTVRNNAGKILEGATVKVYKNGSLTAEKNTAYNGSYEIGLSAGSYKVVASKAGYLPDSVNVNVQVGENLTGIDFTLTENFAVITGTVADKTGKALENVTINLTGTNGNATFSTDANGSFLYSRLLGGTYEIAFSKEGYADTTISGYVVHDGESKILNVEMYSLDGSVNGTIKDSKGNALEGATVMLFNSDKSYNALTASDGSYQINAVAYGMYNLTALKAGFTSTDTLSVSVTKDAPSVKVDFNALTENNAEVRGKITDENGNPLADVSVSVSGSYGSGNAVTDNSGNFAISALTPGSYSLSAFKDDYSTVDTTVNITGTVTVNLTLIKNKATIEGVVADELGQPLPFLPQIEAVANTGQNYMTLANSTGIFQFDEVADDAEYMIFTNIYKEGYSNDTVQVSVPKGANKIENVKLEIKVNNSQIKGSTDIGGVAISVTNKGTGEKKIYTSASDGSFFVNFLRAGNYNLTPQKAGYVFTPSSKDVTLSISDTAVVNFTARANTGNLTVNALASAGQGLEQVDISVVSSDTVHVFNGKTDAEGKAEFKDIPAATYIIRASKQGYTAVPESFTKSISAGADVSVGFTMTENTGGVSGKVLENGSTPVANINVKLLFENSGESKFATTDNSGKYEFSELTGGEVEVTAVQPGFVSDTLKFNLSPGVRLTDKNITVIASVVKIKGKVVYRGAGVRGVKISLTSTNTFEAETDANGVFLFDNIPIKSGVNDTTIYDVRINDARYPSIGEVLKLTSADLGKTVTLADFLIPSGQIILNFSDGKNPLGGVSVTFSEPSGQTTTMVTASDGQFKSAANLKAGTYSISAKKENYLVPEAKYLSVSLPTDTSVVERKILIPFEIHPIDSLAADENGIVKITFSLDASAYSGKLFYRRASSGIFMETDLAKHDGYFEGIIPAQFSMEEILYYSEIVNATDSIEYTSDVYSIKPSAKGILTYLSVAPAIQGILLRTGDIYRLTLKVRDGLNNDLSKNFVGSNPKGTITWEVDKPDSVSVKVTDSQNPTVIELMPQYDGDYRLKVTARYEGTALNETFVFTSGSVPLASVAITAAQTRISNRAGGVQFSATATDSTGRLILLGDMLTWKVEPATAGSIDKNGLFVPADTNYIGNPIIIAEDKLSGFHAEKVISVYATVQPSSAYDLSDGTGMSLHIPKGILAFPIEIFLSRSKPGPSKKVYTPLGQNVSFTVSDKIYNIQYSSSTALQGDSLSGFCELTLPVDNSLQFFEGEKQIGKYNAKDKNWEILELSEKGNTFVKTNRFRKFGQYTVLTQNEPLGLKHVSVLPTPFSPMVAPLKIGYFLTTSDRFARVTIRIYNVRGELVRTILENDLQKPGRYGSRAGIKEITWDGITDEGRMARNGRYIMKITAKDSQGEESKLVQIVLIK